MDAEVDRHAVLRIVDANTNRAAEAARVLEDHARFVLQDARLSARFKSLRHDLTAAVGAFDAASLSLYRDTRTDVGTTVSHPAEQRRSTTADVLAAAGSRLGQALRTIEEYGKTLDPQISGRIEALRYTAYTLSRDLHFMSQARRKLCGVTLYVLVQPSALGDGWLDAAAEALTGGAQALQLRDKHLPDRPLLEHARRLRALCDEHDALLMINDRADIAAACGADGVHVGQDDLPVADARRLLGPQRVIGVSTHTTEQARQALENPPDYLAIGPMFDSATKPQAHIAGPQTLDEVRALTSLPLVAIGGVTPQNAARLGSADILAVCSAIMGAPDIRSATRAFRAVARRDVSQSACPTADFGR